MTSPAMDDVMAATMVVRSNNVVNQFAFLPPGAEVARQVAVKGSVRADFAKVFSALLEVFYTHDRNQTHLRDATADPGSADSYVAGPPDQLGLNATLQARF